MAKEQRKEDIGRNGRRLINGNLQWLLIALLAGGFSIGGVTFVNKDTADSIASLKTRSAVIEQKVTMLEAIDNMDKARVDEKFQDLKDDIKELKTEFRKYQEEQRAVNKSLMNTMRKLLEKQK